MIVTFNLPFKAFSINAAYYKNRFIKTMEFRDWQTLVLEHLNDIKLLDDLRLEYERVGGVFAVELTFVYPYPIYYNKQKTISSKTFDLSNVEKPLLDVIFGDRLGINDKYVVELNSAKRAGACHEIQITLELQPDSDT